MAQVTDRTVGTNPTGFDMRTELNNIIGALESDNSGSSEPLNPVAYMKWLDTSNATYYYYKERNHDNTAWVTLFRYTVDTKIMEVVSNGVVLQDSALVHKTGNETIEGVKVFSSNTIFNSNITQKTPGTSSVYIRNLAGYNHIDSYNDPLNNTYPLIINSSRLLLQIGDSNALFIDDNKNVLVNSGGLGYTTGAGGTVTQLTSKSTSVALNKPSGKIIMNSQSLAAGVGVTFGVGNSLVTTSDNIIVSHQSVGAGTGTYSVGVDSIGTGSFGIYVKNTGGASLSEAIVLNFTIIKGANS